MNLFSLILLNTLIIVSLSGLTFIFFSRFRQLGRPRLPDEKLPFVSIIVPARNEEGKIERCLRSLAEQDYPRFEIVVIDDRSTDRTGEIIAEMAEKYPRIKALRGKETPVGWIGKCNALVQAVPHASGEWFLFTDADTCHTPHSIRTSVDYAVSLNSDLISFMPVQELGSFWERVVMPVLLGSFLVGDPLNTVNDPKDERAYAYGQYILIKRHVYESVGGHYSVRNQILDDIVLARVVKKAGYRIYAADGAQLYSVRMYSDLQSLWYGWTKNAYALIECNLGYLFLILLLINSGILLPFMHVSALLSMVASGETTGPFIPMAVCVAIEFGMLYAWYLRTKRHYTGVEWYHFCLLPLGSLTVTALYLTSAYLVLSGSKVNWKGRHYRVNTSKSIEPIASEDEVFIPQAVPPVAVREPMTEKALVHAEAID